MIFIPIPFQIRDQFLLNYQIIYKEDFRTYGC